MPGSTLDIGIGREKTTGDGKRVAAEHTKSAMLRYEPHQPRGSIEAGVLSDSALGREVGSWAGRKPARGNAELNGNNVEVLFVVPPAPNLPDLALSRPNHGSERSPVKSGNCSEKLEARVGIEPTHKGFADLSLTTWVPRPSSLR